MNELDIFAMALDLATPEERAQYLAKTCGGDTTLRARVEALLRSSEMAGSFLETPPSGVATSVEVLRAAAADGISLGFLQPSDAPGSLGRLDHYEILEIVGSGGMGVVLKARDEKLQRVVAIKMMAEALAASPIARRRFVGEARAAAAIRDDHVVSIYAVEDAGPIPYLVMELITGVSLQQRLEQTGPLEMREICSIGMQIASGLAAAHAQGVIHRDIKPANILLENGVGRVKITDFGLARVTDDASTSQTGLIAGTPQYMSPEQARGEIIDARTDLFSLGSTLYAMCTGRAPFRGGATMAVLKRVCDEGPSPIREANPSIPQWLVVLIDQLQAKEPAQRIQSAGEVAEQLRQYLVGRFDAAEFPAVGTPWRTGGAKRRRWALAAAAAVFLCLVGALSLSEATGMTQVVPTVIRIVTGEGTLVVETGDPAVRVTVEGDGGLAITGAGLEEIRLRPGSYRVHADKDGQRVPLDKDQVHVIRGGREIIKVKLESPAIATAAKVERGAFVLLAAGMERKFDTLAEAVLTATNGDTIEIRGNGPFVTQPIDMGNVALTIRAGSSFRPFIECVYSDPKPFPGYYFFNSQGSLTVEGLEFHYALPDLVTQPRVLIGPGRALHVANCTFRLSKPSGWTWNDGRTKECVVRNCAFYNSSLEGWKTLSGHPRAGFRSLFDNCIICGVITDYHFGAQLPDASASISRTTHMGPIAIKFHVEGWPTASPRAEARWLACDVSSSILGGAITETYQDLREGQALDGAQVVERMRRLVAWRGEQNLYTLDFGAEKRERFRISNVAFGGSHSEGGPSDLDEWRKFWNSPETGSIVDPVRFHGGNLHSRLSTAPEQLTAEAFRLRPDSAGYSAGPDGKDLGADVGLVGPVAAYERWKKTPEYQEWLTETGQEK